MNRLVALTLVISTAIAVAMPSRADGPVCQGPRCVPGSLTLGAYEFRFNVLLPPGYDGPGNTRRYPVLYLLMGGVGGDVTGHNQDAWLRDTDVEGFTATLPIDQQAIVVMPAPGTYTDSRDGSMKWETFHVRTLIPYIDANYRTLADRSHRAMAGLSWGGFGTMHYAARHPDLFVAAGSFSGAVDVVEPPFGPALGGLLTGTLACGSDGTRDAVDECGGYVYRPGDPVGPWGDYVSDHVWWRGNNPVDLAPNYGGVSLYVASGNGFPCDREDAVAVTSPLPYRELEPAYTKLEPVVGHMAQNFDAALTAAHVEHRANLRPCGIHSWRYFFGDLASFWPQMFAAWGNAPPGSFDFRSVELQFSAWDWTFTADPARATEFLDVSDASASGLTLTGSGTELVTTSRSFAPGQTLTLTGAVEPSVIADSAGRITFHVDLGPAHRFQQYTVVQRALEARGDYWTTRTVVFG